MPGKRQPAIIEFFEDIEDPRRDNANRRHDLIDIIVIAVAGTVCGADSWTEIEFTGKAKEEWLRTFLKLPNGIPSHDTFGRVFSIIDPEEFRASFGRFVAAIVELAPREVVAIDGKTVRRSHDRSNGKEAIHMVSAWAAENRVVLGQIKTDEKSNEITAIPELLKTLALKDVIVTIDAMGCQKDIAEQIVDAGADYVLALKGNQETIHDDANHFFDACLNDEFETGDWSIVEKEETSHGRLEKRTCFVTQDLSDLSTAAEWKGIKSLVIILSERTVDGKKSTERRLYISSLEYKGRKFNEIVRAHWGIENRLHWVMDMAFREDECRVRQGDAAENLAMLRHLALNLIKQTPTTKYKAGVKARRLAAAMDNNYLRDVLLSAAA
jgi:predicted transposase YbfD/YdcC